MNFPAFGKIEKGQDYIERPSVYAVIFDDNGRFALCVVRQRLFLPGGGIDKDENDEQALLREVKEETGLLVEIGQEIGRADEYVHALNEGYFKKMGTFYLAKFIAQAGDGETDHQLIWLAAEEITLPWGHGSHKWAFERAAHRS